MNQTQMIYNASMPELPEVETIRRQLEGIVLGKAIAEIDIRFSKTVRGDLNLVIGSKIQRLGRRAKVLIVEFANGYRMLVHLKMTGQIIYESQKYKLKAKSFAITGSDVRYGMGAAKNLRAKQHDLPNKHTHLIFTLSDESRLFYNDIRKFGWIKIVGPQDSMPFLDSLGPEPLSDDFSLGYFVGIIKLWKRSTKLLLMDQTKIAGVGNIYANEALFMAGIHPVRPGIKLSGAQINKLHSAVIESLTKGLKYGGSSRTNYVDANGKKGSMQDHFLVYDRSGKTCLTCGSLIKKIIVGGRGTFYCPRCQRR